MAWDGRTLGTIGRDRAALVREDWMGRNEPLPAMGELDRMEKETHIVGLVFRWSREQCSLDHQWLPQMPVSQFPRLWQEEV